MVHLKVRHVGHSIRIVNVSCVSYTFPQCEVASQAGSCHFVYFDPKRFPFLWNILLVSNPAFEFNNYFDSQIL